MSNINEKLDFIKKLIQEEDFLKGRGLSNEVNIRIFCYNPKDEMAVRHFVKQLKSENLKCNLIEIDLYKQFLKICEDKKILDKIPALEEKKGKHFIRNQFEKSCDAKTFAQSMYSGNYEDGDVLLLTGVGKVFPFMRIHGLLEAMQPIFDKTPILVMYPGEFDGHYVKLFNRLKANEYYRAFKAI